jgi:hypothetical protein
MPMDHARSAKRRGRIRDSLAARLARSLAAASASEAGVTLVEVLMSVMILATITVSTFNGIDNSNRSAALGRARSQGETLAEQDEERLRSLPITKLREIEGLGASGEVTERKLNGNNYRVTSRATFKNEAGTSTCGSTTSPEADYYETRSEVSWGALTEGKSTVLNSFGSKPVIETSVIAPPPGASLLVQVNNAEGKGVEGMEATVKGPEPAVTTYEGKTSAQGCAIFPSFPEGGTYSVNVHRSGYVDQNWITESPSDKCTQETVKLTDGITTKAAYEFDKAGELNPRLVTAPTLLNGLEQRLGAPVRNVVAVNSEFACSFTYKTLLEESKTNPVSGIKSGARVFPYVSAYSVFAGTCKASEPKAFGQSSNPEAKVKGGEENAPEVAVPAMIVRLLKGTKKTETEREERSEKPAYVELEAGLRPRVVLVDTDKGTGEECGSPVAYEPETLPVEYTELGHTVHETPLKLTNEFGGTTTTITPEGKSERGVLRFPGQPYGDYNVCVEYPRGEGHWIYQTAVKNANPGIKTHATAPKEEDGTWVTLYGGYFTHEPQEVPPEELHQSEGTTCPL